MTKEEIETKLIENNITPDGQCITWERAKELIFKDFPNHEEYEARVKIISNYLRI